MLRSKLYSIITYVVIGLFGLVPLLWYRDGTVATGHDMGYSFSPLERILTRLYVWSDAFNFGQDGSWNTGSIPLYLPEAMLELTGLSEQQVQMIVFIFWFVMPGIAMVYLLKTLLRIINMPQKAQLLFILFGSIFYMFNHYLLQGWFVAAKSEFCLVIVTPFVIAFLFRIFFLKENPVFYGLLTAIFLTFFNASGATGVALFGGLLIVFLWFFIYSLILNFMKLPYLLLKKYFIFIAILIPSFLILNAYWILPFVYYTMNNYTEQLIGSGGQAGILNWIDAVSKHATFANLFRLQGFAGWYEIENHPYSATYTKNPLFILISFIFPFLLIYSLYLLKKIDTRTRMVIGFFLGLALLTFFFMSGTRTPMGIIYQNFVRYIPGFAIFRSPFYKFGYVLWITYGVLVAFSLSYILTAISEKINSDSKRSIFTLLLGVFSIVIVLFYSFPFFTGSFFVWDSPLSTMVRPPAHVFEFKEWMQMQNETRRVLLYPPLPSPYLADTYTWNYWSLTPFPNLLSEKGIVSNNGFWSPRQKTTIEQLYLAIERRDKEKAERLMKLLNISHILFRRDVKTDLPWTPLATSIDKYEMTITKTSWLSLEKTFGEWFLYRVLINDEGRDFITAKNENVMITNLAHLDKVMQFFTMDSVYFLDNDLGSEKFLWPGNAFITSECIGCDLGGEVETYPAPTVRLLPNSIFYQYILVREQVRLSRVKTAEDRAVLLSSYAFRRLLEIQKLIGGRSSHELSFEELNLIVRVFKEINSQLREIISLQEKSIKSESLNSPFVKHVQSFVDIFRKEVKQFKYALPRREDIDEQFLEMTNNLNMLKISTEKKLWITITENEPRFILQIPKDGMYSLSILTGRDMNYDEVFQRDFQTSGILHIPDMSVGMSVVKKTDNAYDFGAVRLQAGQHRVFLQLPSYKSLFSLPKITIPSYGDPFTTTIQGIEQNNMYQLDFDYNTESTHGISYKAVAQLENGRKIELLMVRLTDNYLPHQKILVTTPATLNRIENITFTIEHSSLASFAFPLIIENITLRSLINPVLLAKQEMVQPLATNEKVINVVQKYRKINPTLYSVDISNAKRPFYLVLNEGFSKDWQAYVLKDETVDCTGFFCGIKTIVSLLWEGKKLPEKNHTQAYGFSNAWILTDIKHDKFKVIFLYFPQLFAYLGFAVTFIGVGISTILFIYFIRKRSF